MRISSESFSPVLNLRGITLKHAGYRPHSKARAQRENDLGAPGILRPNRSSFRLTHLRPHIFLQRMWGLNQHEWDVIIRYGNADAIGEIAYMIVIYTSVRKAEALAYQKFDAKEIHNGRGDALKHCYLSALLASWKGKAFAKDFMDAHEMVDGNPTNEKEMDLHNNEIGRDIVQKNPSASDERLGELCMKAVIDGRTWVIDGPGKNYSP